MNEMFDRVLRNKSGLIFPLHIALFCKISSSGCERELCTAGKKKGHQAEAFLPVEIYKNRNFENIAIVNTFKKFYFAFPFFFPHFYYN